MKIQEAILSRRSIRSFLEKDIPIKTIKEILKIAARAPSGTNIQPWKVNVLSGGFLTKFKKKVKLEFLENGENHSVDRLHYMEKFREPYLKRRRKVGWDLYNILDIQKGDFIKTKNFHAKNFDFFDAPIGLIFSIEKDLGWMSWLDYGMFMQNICLTARSYGLHTCSQAAWGMMHKKVEQLLEIDANSIVHCGMALGYENLENKINDLKTNREGLEEFVTYNS